MCNEQVIGRAKTVLVFGQDRDRRGVVSVVVVRGLDEPGGTGIRFTGPVRFARSVKTHVRRVILPIVARIVTGIGLSRQSYEVSAVNIGAASSLDVGVSVSGFSADVAIFLAMLSEALQIPIADDFVSTGHIASVHGDIGAVRSIPAKVKAAEADGSLRRFICPDFTDDCSLKVLCPEERERSIKALMEARHSIGVKSVRSISELAREVFAENCVVGAALRRGFFQACVTEGEGGDIVRGVIDFLCRNAERRFWDVLQHHFITGEVDRGKELLRVFAEFHIAKRLYPPKVGHKLLRLVFSLPPSVRRERMDPPILGSSLCASLIGFAKDEDYEDVPVLFDAVRCTGAGWTSLAEEASGMDTAQAASSDATAFKMVACLISEDTLARKFGVPIDSARASYVLGTSTVESYDQFLETLLGFYVHLQRYLAPDTIGLVDTNAVRAETVALLERTFHGKGGWETAFAQSKDGTQGGMRSVLDAMTQRFKTEKQTAYVQRVFKEAVNPLEWNQRVEFVRSAMKCLAPFLPPEIAGNPPERFARDYEMIARIYVESMDRVRQLLGAM